MLVSQQHRPSEQPMRTALLTAHYGDPFWIRLLTTRARRAFPNLAYEDIYVIDQDRTASSAERLRSLLGPVNIMRYPRSDPHFEMTGHDHAHVLNLAVREIDADVLMIFDSDAHPVDTRTAGLIEGLLDTNDAILAAYATAGPFSHPSFMVFGHAVDRSDLLFDAQQIERGVDTGRLIYTQICDAGLRATLLRPSPAFGGLWGSLYLERSVYHHGSGSFGSNRDPRFVRQVTTWRREERFVRRRVAEGRYTLTSSEERMLRASFDLKRLRGRVEAMLLRRVPRVAKHLGLAAHPTYRGLE